MDRLALAKARWATSTRQGKRVELEWLLGDGFLPVCLAEHLPDSVWLLYDILNARYLNAGNDRQRSRWQRHMDQLNDWVKEKGKD